MGVTSALHANRAAAIASFTIYANTKERLLLPTDRNRLRAFYRQSWLAFQAGQPLEPLQALVAEVVAEHPEYHAQVLTADAVQREFSVAGGEINPFLHMGMHVALREQVAADRPAGIAEQYQKLAKRVGERHASEHQMMECLGQVMWEAQRAGIAPDEKAFLNCVRRLRKAKRST